jgi:hypothetical protein
MCFSEIWWSFISLVLWFAVFKCNLHALKCYVDDNFSFCIVGDFEFYTKYQAFLPSDQVRLLQLWDKISLPHEEEKQICGTCIPIIEFDVDPNVMTVKMSEAKKSELISACTAFTVHGACKTLQELIFILFLFLNQVYCARGILPKLHITATGGY